MNSSDLHSLADRIARNRGITHAEALALLGRRGNEAKARRRTFGVLNTTVADRTNFDGIEQPHRRFWWEDSN